MSDSFNGLPDRAREKLKHSEQPEWVEPMLATLMDVYFLSHRNTEGEAYLEEACRRGWEGLIANRATT